MSSDVKRFRVGVLERDGHRCVYCGWAPLAECDEVMLVLDHVVAKADGGPDDPSNLITACTWCNSRKGRKSIWRFLTGELFPVAA